MTKNLSNFSLVQRSSISISQGSIRSQVNVQPSENELSSGSTDPVCILTWTSGGLARMIHALFSLF